MKSTIRSNQGKGINSKAMPKKKPLTFYRSRTELMCEVV